MVRAVVFALLATNAIAAPTSIRNNDTCDIGLFPAATLLLPYFEVDLAPTAGQGETTLFTVINVSNREQIAHVTLWTDRAFPVIGFDLHLTGYDSQSINLRDVLSGQIAPPRGTGSSSSPVGRLSHRNERLDVDRCDDLPGTLAPSIVARMRDAFTLGILSGTGGCSGIGGQHARAIGYATIDVVGSRLPNDAIAGWTYLNLSSQRGEAAQAWVISSMTAEGRYALDSDAVALGNGCTGFTDVSELTDGVQPIGPAPNVNP
jgi:hypothetical protein